MKVSKNSLLVIEKLKEVIFSEEIVLKYRNNITDFTRKRKQPFGQMLIFMINFLIKSLPIEIDNFVKHINSVASSFKIENFTNSAFVQKRRKIKPEVFKYLTQVISDNFYVKDNANAKFLYGFRILAVDGSKLTLPFTKELKSYFGVTKNQHKTEVVQGISSVLYDVLNYIALDAVLENVNSSERELALRHKEHWRKNDLVIYDRGYPSYDFINEHIIAGIDALVRVRKNQNTAVIAFINSKKRTSIVDILPHKEQNFIGKEYNKETTIKVRLIRVDLPSGEVEILMTTLLDSQIYPSSMFKELYFLRWGIETFYDALKNKLKVEFFTGYSKNTIMQDFFCAIFVSNLQSVIVNSLQEEINKKNLNTRLDYKINTNLSYGFLKNRVLELLIKEAPLESVLIELENIFLQNTIPIRENRNNMRNTGKYRVRSKPKVTKNQRDAI